MIFEDKVKQALENYEAGYNPADWTDMESRLDKAQVAKSSTIGKGLMIAASGIAVAGLIYYFSASDSESNKKKNAVVPSQHIVQNEGRENPIQSESKTESNHQNQESRIQNPEVNNNSNKEKVLATTNSSEEKLGGAEKTLAQNATSVTENKTTNQNPVQPPTSHLPPPTSSVLSASFQADRNKVCEGTSVKFTADGNDVSCTYLWSFGDGGSSAEQNPTHVFAEEGIYSVRLRVSSTEDQKWEEQKKTLTVLAAASLQINYSASEDNTLLINFDADADNKGIAWRWEFGDGQTSSEQSPV
ncbi:MAG: PKD domain-containing protein, partial [Bacteroidota bacterium]